MLGFVNISSHNYYHQKENFRTYYGDICMSPSREWKIIHVLGHHFCTNTILDIQTYLLEPFLFYYPHKKSTASKYLCYIYAPLVLWPLLFIYLHYSKIYYVTRGHTKHISKADLLPWTIPATLYFITGQPLFTILKMWLFVILVGGLWFSLVGITTTHYHPEIFIDGDKPRFEEEMDWGIHQLDTVGDKVEVHGSLFWSFLMLGDHALHHLFPALDHGVLNHLYPVVEETLKEFNLKLRMKNTLTMVKGHFLTLEKEVGNPNNPSLS
ncbi:hypothetical protein FQR65_LT06426 [Abscondita terminalis]|nr:hypothetical protein FQR65_LT06426 [Abscondita terminalis]